MGGGSLPLFLERGWGYDSIWVTNCCYIF